MKKAAVNTGKRNKTDKTREDKNLNDVVKSGYIANHHLLPQIKSAAVRRFLADTKDYFAILSEAGKVETPYGTVAYLAQVVLGESKAVILEHKKTLDNTQGRLAISFMLTRDWSEFRIIFVNKIGQPLYETAPAYYWNTLEMPSLSRHFLLACYVKYHQLSLEGRTSVTSIELIKFDLVNFVIQFLKEGNMLTKAVSELEEKRADIARPQPFFADLQAGAVFGLYLASCVSYDGPIEICFQDGLPLVNYPLPNGVLVFKVGQLAHHVLKNPASKAALPGAVRAVVSQISNPCLCVGAEYSPYLDWQDKIQDFTSPVAEKADIPAASYETDSPAAPFMLARRLLLEWRSKQSEAEKNEAGSKIKLYQYWLCPSCGNFTMVEREAVHSSEADIAELAKNLASYTASLDDHLCSHCRNHLDIFCLQYTALNFVWTWPGVELLLETARMPTDGRLLRGWGWIRSSDLHDAAKFRSCSDLLTEESLYGNLNRFSSLVVRTRELVRQSLSQLSCAEDTSFVKMLPLGGSLFLRLENATKSSGADADRDDGYFAELEGKQYFVFPIDLSSPIFALPANFIKLNKILKADYYFDWTSFVIFSQEHFNSVFQVEGREVRLNWIGSHKQRIEVVSQKAFFSRNLAELVSQAFYGGSYPEELLVKICADDFKLFQEQEAVFDFAQRLKAEGEPIRCEAEGRSYNLQTDEEGTRKVSAEELHEAPERPMRLAQFTFSKAPLNLYRCRCGLEAVPSLEFVDSSLFSNLKYVKYDKRLEYVVKDSNHKLNTEMFSRYEELDKNREKALKASGGKLAIALVEIESLSRRAKKVPGTFQRTGQMLPSENEALFLEAFKKWFPRMDEVRIINKQKVKTSYLQPVWAMRCPYHIVYMKPSSESLQNLSSRRLFRLDRLSGIFSVYKFRRLWVVYGPNASFAALDPRLAVGIARAGNINLDDFFKVTVPHQDILILSDLETDNEDLLEVWHRFCRRFRQFKGVAKDFFLYERACFCGIAVGRFQVKVYPL
ncbi:MAG: hypothetical protein ACI38Q_07060 [Candidatus Bruticola sp.]